MKKLFGVNPDLLGDGRVTFEWSSKGNFLAASGPKRKVVILDRNGRLYDEISLPQPELPTGDVRAPGCLQLQWDPSGEQLAMLPNGNTFIYIWSSISKELQKIDTDFKTQEFTCLAWSKNGLYLAAGTGKGNVLIYNSREKKKTPYVGKHTKKIVCCTWNKDNMLAMASSDKIVSITDGASGETSRSFVLKGEPYDLCVSDRKEDGYAKKEENTYSLNVGRKTIYIMECSEGSEKPIELAFLEAYGPIQTHLWFGDGYILVAFKSGQVVVVSSHSREIAEEIYSSKILDVLSDAAYSPALGRIALGGSCCVRVLDASGTDYSEIKSDAVDLEPNMTVEKVGWTRDGQVLTVATSTGYISSYLAALPVVFDYHATKVIYLTSLLEMSVVDINRRGMPYKIDIETEPAFCALGPNHAAVGMNNQVWMYSLAKGTSKIVNRRDYLGSVNVIKLNSSHAAVLTEGKVIVHPIEVGPGKTMDDFDLVLPPASQGQGKPSAVMSVALTDNFIITGDKKGSLVYYLVSDGSLVNEYRHDDGAVLRMYPQPEGARLVFEDEKGNLNLFNPVNDQVLLVPNFTGKAENIMWDVGDANVFVIADLSSLYVFLYLPVSISGARVELIGKQGLPPTHTPLMVYNGTVGCRLRNGSLDSIALDTHRAIQMQDALSRAAPQRRFLQNLKLGRLKGAWDCAVQMKNAESWQQLAVASLELLDVHMAVAAYRMLGDASMVLSLERIKQYEDKNLLAAHVMVLLDRDHSQAQELFLRSSQPKAALEMRKDLKHWSEALKLAEQLDPDNIAHICKEHAAALEMVGEYNNAKNHYQQAIESGAVSSSGQEDKELEVACRAGIARCTLQLGDIRQGRAMAMQINSQQLFKECALILEGLSQLTEAAEMYERAGQYERAASIYIQTKNFNAAAPLMARISSSKLQLQFAKAKEAEGRFGEAATAYEAAGDLDAVVRLALGQLNAPQRAYAIVRKTQSIESAGLLSKYCMQNRDFKGAVEFLLMSNQMDMAFDIATKYAEMDTFARIVKASTKPVDYQRIAQYYEEHGEYDKAGDMWDACGEYGKAVKLYLKVNSDDALDKAIGIVEKTKNHSLGVVVLDYVNEEKDGSAKDEYSFKLNIAMGRFVEAARDAMEMARFEQEEGNYRVAHDKLFATVKQLELLNVRPPSDLMRALMLLHSYTLVKSLIAINDHTTAARMLVRVARNISKFPKHVVPILTSTIIECNRAGLKQTAFEYASMLMRPEYRNQVAMKYKKKIELMVRKPDKDAEELEEGMLNCCFCGLPGPESELQCMSCQNVIPFDVSTGKRMVLSDWSECPCCRFPCSAAQFIRILAAERRCPMCNEEVNLDSVRKVIDPLGQIKKKQELVSGLGSGQL